MFTKLSLSLTLTLFAVGLSSGLKLQPSENSEESCAVVHPQQSVNMTWIESVDFWYFIATSKQEWYELLSVLTTAEEFAELTDEQLQKSCIMTTRISPEEKSVRFYGLNNRKFNEFQVAFPKYRKGVIDWATGGPAPEHVGTAYVVLTDNKTYYMGVDIFDDGTKGYTILSPYASIPEEEMEKIQKLIKAHKFPKDSFYALGTDCDNNEYLNSVKRMTANAK